MPLFSAKSKLERACKAKVQPIENFLLIEEERPNLPVSPQNVPQRCSNRHSIASEPSKHLDPETFLRHVVASGQDGMLDLVNYVDGGSLGNPGPVLGW